MSFQRRDLFGGPSGDLFGDAPPAALSVSSGAVFSGDPDRVRARLAAILAEARSAPAMSARTVRLYETIVPQMSRWLPDDEAGRACRDVEAELRRLRGEGAPTPARSRPPQ